MSIVRTIRMLPLFLKKKYKERKFKRVADLGPDVVIHSIANIRCDKDSRVEIKGHNDLLCSILAIGGGSVEIGKYTTIRGYSVIGAVKRIYIGDHVIISNNVHIYDNNNHPTSPKTRIEMCESGFYSSLWEWTKSDAAEVIIEDNVWIGERSTVLKGVTIGKGSIVGCDSVVTKDVPPYSIVAGNPARIVKYLGPISTDK